MGSAAGAPLPAAGAGGGAGDLLLAARAAARTHRVWRAAAAAAGWRAVAALILGARHPGEALQGWAALARDLEHDGGRWEVVVQLPLRILA